jgi:hypothetical protein
VWGLGLGVGPPPPNPKAPIPNPQSPIPISKIIKINKIILKIKTKLNNLNSLIKY